MCMETDTYFYSFAMWVLIGLFIKGCVNTGIRVAMIFIKTKTIGEEILERSNSVKNLKRNGFITSKSFEFCFQTSPRWIGYCPVKSQWL